MKTKEIKCYINKSQIGILSLKDDRYIHIYNTNNIAKSLLKAKIIIEIPEREGTISETQFDTMIQDLITWWTKGNEYNKPAQPVSDWRKILFGEEK